MERTGKNIGDLVLFNRSAHFAFVYQKTEKLVSAVYLVTNLISDNEPLKTRIRENALALMSVARSAIIVVSELAPPGRWRNR